MYIPRRVSGMFSKDHILTYGRDWEVGEMVGSSYNAHCISTAWFISWHIAGAQKMIGEFKYSKGPISFDEGLCW